mmetsp:Transcript_6237/g.15683  ORF Transcript_6237/g.15683 Transcript_6237/m.15683 type:complete len:615 (-) Transcript_6237:61-1905(-)
MATITTRADSSNSSSSTYKNGSSISSSSTLSAEKAGSRGSSKRSASNHDHDSDDNNNVIDGESLIKSSEMQPLTETGENVIEKLLPHDGSDDDGAGHRMEVFETEYYEPSSSSSWEDWLYPPSLPRSCQLLRRENLAIPACYLLVGILQGLSGPLINVYPLDLGATEAQQTTLSSIRSLPASFKLVFGFISDNLPLGGYRRKSYMSIGWGLAAASMMSLILTTDLTLEEEEYIKDDGSTAVRSIAPENAPSVPFLSLCMLLFGTGFWMADVMGDSVVAEKAKLEPEHSRGSTQSSCYSYRFFGLMCAAPFSTGLYKWLGPYYVFCLLAVFPLSILPLVYCLGEVRDAPVASTKEQCNEIWNTVCSRSVWQPMGFVYVYNVLQVGNAAWREYLKTVLGFTSFQLNLIYIVSVVLLYLGVITYKYYIINWSWRLVYVVTTLLNGFFSMLQVLLILGITFGMSSFLFALGDDAFAEFIQGIQFLPTTIMMVHLCPAGSEGASYAMFTTVNNSAGTVSVALSTMMLGIWDVSKEALSNGDLSGMVNLTVLTTAFQISGIFLVGLLPRTKEELFALKEQDFGSSKIGGAIFLVIISSSLLYSICVGVLNVVAPGWSGES